MNHFSMDEFRCKCCHRVNMDPEFLFKLDFARDLAGIPFHITSGFRCESHNKAVGGSDDSSHVIGMAADIRATNSTQRMKIVNALLETGFMRIGIASNFIHADDDRDKDQEVMWVYSDIA